MSIGFIADLHLHRDAPEVSALAARYFREARELDVLWILGDLFDAWIGDDCPFTDLEPAMAELTSLCASGTSVHVMHGNRDFLLGQGFADRTGVQVHTADHVLIDQSTGLPVDHTGSQGSTDTYLLMHGDTLCTDDTDYLALRETLRSPAWQGDFLNRPIAERAAIAQQMRDGSRDAMKGKTTAILDVADEAVQQTLLEQGVSTLIHGHTHRPADHQPATTHAPHDSRRVVLGDWHADGAQVALLDSHSGLRLTPYPA